MRVSTVLGFRIFSHELKQAYLQRKDKMTRVLYLRPKEEDRELFGLYNNEVMEIVKTLYGVCDARDYWSIKIIAHDERDLKMTPFMGHVVPWLTYRVNDCSLVGSATAMPPDVFSYPVSRTVTVIDWWGERPSSTYTY